jgi:hypothetical protein
MNTTTAIAELLSVRRTAATRLVRIRCPFCHEVHTHGWPHGQQTIGHRVAPCAGGAGGYTIPTPRKEAPHE